jgi:hypothetical protein
VLAAQALRDVVWPRLRRARRRLVAALLALLVLPSNLVVVTALFSTIARHDPSVYVSTSEAAGLAWLDAHAGPTDVVAAAPEMGQFIPVHSAARVLYGHPFETVHAEQQEQLLIDFYAGRTAPGDFVQANGVTYVFVGPRERALMPGDLALPWPVAFAQGDVAIYAP